MQTEFRLGSGTRFDLINSEICVQCSSAEKPTDKWNNGEKPNKKRQGTGLETEKQKTYSGQKEKGRKMKRKKWKGEQTNVYKWQMFVLCSMAFWLIVCGGGPIVLQSLMQVPDFVIPAFILDLPLFRPYLMWISIVV